MRAERPIKPDWNRLYELAAGQEGLFTTRQAIEAGYSHPLLIHHIDRGRFHRLGRGIYRLVHFPAGEHEDLVAIWLWSAQQGVFSHQTALAPHGLSDLLPARTHLTLPLAWQHRRLRIPPGVVLHHGDIGESERAWIGAVPVTAPGRTLLDCAAAHMAPEHLQQALTQALRRGLVTRTDLREVEIALARQGAHELDALAAGHRHPRLTHAVPSAGDLG